jgi:Zn-dependent peptidase ImmA (M78 family)/formiminotetrahydrofolate cyclodeaminase
MENKLLDHKTNDLLEMFGMGKPTPGSGSAAALQVLLSAKLIQTVVSLTAKSKFQPKYDEWLPTLQKWNSDIEDRIYPELKRLFQQDSDQFDQFIDACRKWEKEENIEQREEFNRQKLKWLAIVTDNALELAKLSAELGDAATYAFDHGFKDVRGDSAVALNGAVAALGGCLAIIELNLTSFRWDDWVWEIRDELLRLKLAHHQLTERAGRCVEGLQKENEIKHADAFEEIRADFRSGKWEEVVRSEKSIEQLARDVQNALWMNRDLIWKAEMPGNYLDVLKPDVVIRELLGYQFSYASLGSFVADDGKQYKTAGLVDKQNKIVTVSRDMQEKVQNFTSAHELGHVLLHKGLVLHRDRPIDGTEINKDIREREADKFATYFLMPAKFVRAYFVELFGTERFMIDENTALKLGEGRANAFRKKLKNIDGLAFYMARAEHFHIRSFKSLSQIFNVSDSAMAYRLKELGLIEY